MKTNKEQRQAIRIGALFLLWTGGGYFGTQYFVTEWLPFDPQLFFLCLLIFLIFTPLAYYQLQKRWHYIGELIYLALPLDFLIPWSLYPALLLVSLFVLPRYALWAYGVEGNATVVSVRTIPAFDDDLRTIPGSCVDYTYEVGDGRYQKSACSGGHPFKEEPPDDFVPLYYAAFAPQWAVLQLPALYRLLDGLIVWWVWIVVGWLVGTAVISPKRYPPPPPAPPQTPSELLQRFDLVQLLTDEDDPALWSAVIQSHFPMPENEKTFVPGLRFGIGEVHPTSKYLLQPVIGTRFARADKYHLVRTNFAAETQGDHHFDPDLAPLVAMRLIYVGIPHLPERPLFAIVVPRPSVKVDKVPVYTAVNHPGAAATGATYYWLHSEDGRWQKSDERVNWWYEG